jgi:hypothetical protein
MASPDQTWDFSVGDRLQIVGGSYRGLEGEVTGFTDEGLIRVNVVAVGRIFSVQVDYCAVTPVPRFDALSWSACTNVSKLLAVLRGQINDRKLRLFALAYYPGRRPFVCPDEPHYVFDAAVRFAEGTLEQDALSVIGNKLRLQRATEEDKRGIRYGLESFARDPFRYVLDTYHPGKPEQADLLRCIVGNPFRAVSIDPSWLTWNDRTIPALADAIYTDSAFDRLPILADALEEAGCDNAEILNHCRGPSPHARGCWVIDLLLGK